MKDAMSAAFPQSRWFSHVVMAEPSLIDGFVSSLQAFAISAVSQEQKKSAQNVPPAKAPTPPDGVVVAIIQNIYETFRQYHTGCIFRHTSIAGSVPNH